MSEHLQAVAGILTILACAYLFSENRSAIRIRIITTGLLLQLIIALTLLKVPMFQSLFLLFNQLMMALQEATQAGTSFVFGYLGGAASPFVENNPANSFILAFRALPMILVMSALSALLFYWGILPKIVNAFSYLLQRSMGIGGALGLTTTANIFVGMLEAPLLIKPYLHTMNRSELFALMVAGMSTIAGTMMALYAAILGHVIPNAMGHILTASLISAPAAIMIAFIMIPNISNNGTSATLHNSTSASSSIDAITRGTLDGLKLLANVIAMLIVLIALVHLCNLLLTQLPNVNEAPLSLERMLGWCMAPLVWLLGIPWSEATTAGSLMGTKTILNEFMAYLQLAALPKDALSEHSKIIMTYALCGFANLGSLGIMIGGLSALIPQRQSEIIQLGMKSILAGTLTTCLTGAVVGLLLP
ncbi:MAG: nucleoside:proton symporter [Zetaproteobacteria bacterium]|nr:nucleoside:proton symporter [Zetaproteobacteria bacterium]